MFTDARKTVGEENKAIRYRFPLKKENTLGYYRMWRARQLQMLSHDPAKEDGGLCTTAEQQSQVYWS